MPLTAGLIFLRHSLPVIDPAVPAREWHLSADGRQRCRLLAARLVSYKPQKIISSLEPKALETAQIIAETLQMQFESAEGLHEHERRREEHTSREVFEASIRAFFAQPDQLVYGDETADQAYTRFAQAVDTVQNRYHGQAPLVIVSHGTVISLFIARAYGLDPFPVWKSLKLPCMVICSANRPQIISLEPHLP
jgi:broad specificity phosphatase PhoE